MARGKNKAIAERRSAALTEIGTIDALRLRVKNLEEELAEVKKRSEDAIENKNENIRELNRRLQEATSRELEEQKSLNAQLRADLDASKVTLKNIKKKWESLSTRIIDVYASATNLTRSEAAGVLLPIINPEEFTLGEPIVIADKDLIDKARAGKLNNDQLRLLQRKRQGLF